MIKISFIVPVYNVQEYIEECINSLLKQSIDNFEIVVIDDGSVDNSILLVEKIKDSRIRIIKRKNGGLGAARNTGLQEAVGEYIAFIDSDDFIKDNECYEKMYNIAQRDNSDIVSGNGIIYYSKEKSIVMRRDLKFKNCKYMDGEEFLLLSLVTKRMYAPVWLNIYNREFLIKNNLSFQEGLLHEDELFTPQVVLKANRISIYDDEFYMYRQRNGSIINSKFSDKKGYDKLKISLELLNLIPKIKSNDLKKELKKYIVKFSLYSIYTNKLKIVSKEVKKMIWKNSSKNYKIKAGLLYINESLYIIYENFCEILKLIKYKIIGERKC